MTSTHGLVQSEALTVAAQRVDENKLIVHRARILYPEDHALNRIHQDRLSDSQEDYDAAYQRYTNPFGVSKTVDARWPRVGADPYVTEQILGLAE